MVWYEKYESFGQKRAHKIGLSIQTWETFSYTSLEVVKFKQTWLKVAPEAVSVSFP